MNINLNKIIESSDFMAVAKCLFPENKFPTQALTRHLGLKLSLNEDQILALSKFTGLPVSELFESDWKSHNKDGVFTFNKDGFKAELDTNTWITRLTFEGARVHEELIVSKSVLLSEYLGKLDLLIKNYRNG